MKAIVINTDYPAFLDQFYREHPEARHLPYEPHKKIRDEQGFANTVGVARGLAAAGWQSDHIYANNPWLQSAWLIEHGVRPPYKPAYHRIRSPYWASPGEFARRIRWISSTLTTQLALMDPDLILCLNVGIPSGYLKQAKAAGTRIVGYHQAPIRRGMPFHRFDLMLSAIPSFVHAWRKKGINAHHLPLAIDPTEVENLVQGHDYPATFVGSVGGPHNHRSDWLNSLADLREVHVFTNDRQALADAWDQKRVHGPVWGRDMLQTLASSTISLNHHIDVAGQHASNLRLYEATGAGSLLLTDNLADLSNLFVVDEEIISYKGKSECREKIIYYSKHLDEASAIAQQGRQRTLKSHTYENRMKQLTEWLQAGGTV